MTWDQWLYFLSEGSHTQDFYALKKNPSTPARFEPANLGSSGEYDNHWTTGVDAHISEDYVWKLLCNSRFFRLALVDVLDTSFYRRTRFFQTVYTIDECSFLSEDPFHFAVGKLDVL